MGFRFGYTWWWVGDGVLGGGEGGGGEKRRREEERGRRGGPQRDSTMERERGGGGVDTFSCSARRSRVLTPRTNEMASIKFDFPDPFGPMTAVNDVNGPADRVSVSVSQWVSE
jgi:hypothetical protein